MNMRVTINHKNWIWLLLIFFSCKSSLPSQKTNNVHSDASFYIESAVENFYFDKLEQLYILTPENELFKYYNKQNKSVFQFADYNLGDLEHVDVSNPLKILLFYPDFQTIVFLDNTLSEINRIQLQNSDYQDIKAVGLANDNNIWIYDEPNSRLRKISSDRELILDSDPLHLLLNQAVFIEEVFERNNEVYLRDPINGIIVFDNLANYKKTLDVGKIQDLQVIDNQIIYRKSDGQYYQYKALDFEESQLKTSAQFGKGFKTIITEKHVIVGDVNGVYFYGRK